MPADSSDTAVCMRRPNEVKAMPISYSRTDRGRRRSKNQDYLFARDGQIGTFPDLYIIADGMGGHESGEFASQYTVDRVVKEAEQETDRTREQILEKGLRLANAELRELTLAKKLLLGMGTTAVIATVEENGELLVANVGDSRLYVLRGDGLVQITHDHSLVQEMVDIGTITAEEARVHPERNVITRAVGAEDRLMVDFFHTTVKEGEIIFLCTDGVTTMLTDEEITAIIRGSEDLELAADTLVREANSRGGRDNISLILVDLRQEVAHD